jgi:hypothetical protein
MSPAEVAAHVREKRRAQLVRVIHAELEKLLPLVLEADEIPKFVRDVVDLRYGVLPRQAAAATMKALPEGEGGALPEGHAVRALQSGRSCY